MKDNWITYVFGQFHRIYGFNAWEEVSYGLDNVSKIQIRRNEIGFFDRKKSLPDNEPVWLEWRGQNIPFLFDVSKRDLFSFEMGNVIINFDVIAGAFYFLSGWQEYYSDHQGGVGCFPYRRSVQYKLGIIHLPVVNYYFDILKTAIEKAFNTHLKANLWNGKTAGILLTHDLDKINRGWIEGGASEIRKGNILAPIKLLFKRIKGEDDWFNFEEIVGLEEALGARSAFFFLSEQGKYRGIPNADYDIQDATVQQVITSMNQKGWSVGVHGSYGAALEKGMLKVEISRLPVEVNANRFHFLSWNQRITPHLIDESGITIDSTLGFPEHYGFRNSMCHPFNPYNLSEHEAFRFLEYPLNLMDSTFHQAEYLNQSKENIPGICSELLAEVTKFEGCLTILWHNNFFSDYKYEGWKEIYVRILSSFNENDVHYININHFE